MTTKFTAALFLFACSFATTFGQFTQPPAQINVSGSAEVRVVPDEIHLSAMVETRNEALDPARIENDEKIAMVLKFLKTSGIKDNAVQTDFISIQPVYDSNNGSRMVPANYTLQKAIQIRLTGTTNFQAILTGILTNGVNRVNQVDFRSTQLRKYRDEARGMAIRAAKEKAEVLVSEIGVKLGKPYHINATDNLWGGPYANRMNIHNNLVQNISNPGATPDDSGDAFSAGQISISANVNVSFLIE